MISEYTNRGKELMALNKPDQGIKLAFEAKAAFYGLRIFWEATTESCGTLYDKYRVAGSNVVLKNLSSQELERAIREAIWKRRIFLLLWIFWFPFWWAKCRKIHHQLQTHYEEMNQRERDEFMHQAEAEVDEFLKERQ